MANIQVTYDGAYPNLCRGQLTITVDDKVVYRERYCCHSEGSVWFDENWNEHVTDGAIVWSEDVEKFSDEIREAVREELSKYRGCCGGCV